MASAVTVDLESVSQLIRRGLQTDTDENLQEIRLFEKQRGESVVYIVWALTEKMLLDFGLVRDQLVAVRASIIEVRAKKSRESTADRHIHYYILGPEENFASATCVRIAHHGGAMEPAWSKQSFDVVPGEYHKFEVDYNGVLYVLCVEEL